MTEKKQVRKNPSPLVVKGIFYVTATFEDKQYVVSMDYHFLDLKRMVKKSTKEIMLKSTDQSIKRKKQLIQS